MVLEFKLNKYQQSNNVKHDQIFTTEHFWNVKNGMISSKANGINSVVLSEWS